MKDIWQFLNGNKTIICTVLLAVIQPFPVPEPYKSVAITVLTILAGGSLAHHIQKGYFTKSKGH